MEEILKNLDITDCPASLFFPGREFDLLKEIKKKLIKYAKDKTPENLRRIGQLINKILDPIENERRKNLEFINALQKEEISRLEKLRFEALKDEGFSVPPKYLTEEQIKEEASFREAKTVNQELFNTEGSTEVDLLSLHNTISGFLKWCKNGKISFSMTTRCHTCSHGESVSMILRRDQTFEEICQDVYNEDRKGKEAHLRRYEEYVKLAKKYKDT